MSSPVSTPRTTASPWNGPNPPTTWPRLNIERDKAIYAKGVIPTAELDTNKTRMETARADYENAQLLYSRCTVTAPMNGIVRKLDAKVGLQLAVGDPLAEILEIDRVKAVVGIPESDVTAVRDIDTIAISLQALTRADRHRQGALSLFLAGDRGPPLPPGTGH